MNYSLKKQQKLKIKNITGLLGTEDNDTQYSVTTNVSRGEGRMGRTFLVLAALNKI